MASSARLLMERSKNVTKGLNFTMAETSKSARSNATGLLIQKLVFAESKSVRTSTIILAVFNILAAFATACSIVYDCYFAYKRCNPKFKASKFCIRTIHPAETFPLILAIGIVIQGIVFAAVQGQGLTSLFTTGCSVTAQFMWPALFIVPYIQLVFGIECAVRSLRPRPFQARGNHNVKIYIVLVVVMLVVTWIPSNLTKEPDSCFASLMWFITRFGMDGLILLTMTASLMMISAIIIFFRLSTVKLIDEHQRIAASRMVYYLILGTISLAFVIPWFGSLVQNGPGNGDLKLSMMATVVVNLSGLISGLLQLFLRANTATTSFGPRSLKDRKKHEIRMWGPNELVFNNHLMDPLSGPRSPPRNLASRSDSRSSLVGFEKEVGRVISMESVRSPPFELPARYNNNLASSAIEPKTFTNSESAYETVAPAAHTHARKPSYSLFPPERSPDKLLTVPGTRQQEPTSIYDISDLTPPPPIFGPGSRTNHRRDSSMASSATVQIGLRLSHAPELSEEDLPTLPLPSTTYNANATRPQTPESLDIKSFNFSSLPRSPLRPSPLNISTVSPTKSPTYVNKTLPPTPKANIPISRLNESNTQLSPTVYSPDKKTAQTPESATMPKNPLRGNPLGSPISQPEKTVQGGGKSDWI
ncbi:hypothetical protein LHYA1_G003131 [Lachnellula hyalina]|uniref:Uncharacterized protein n=1 Tax=Lachnellula hyalina TaxID=1316788 RepID=A0A8H8R2B7_9HELO|nr:uncharacterized protein LHYA1_G003131 [Lachnellula hyalina]TVY27083.1 hypothetical protein LHYA1_G003131 [Lachnellula hyalina]